MKNIITLLVCCLILSTVSMAQELKNIEYFSPFHEGLAAVKKGEQWAFIDINGRVIIDYRDNIVVATGDQMTCCSMDKSTGYPFFENDRSIIKEVKDGIFLYGYMNSKGETVIKPNFINATHFHKNRAIVLKVSKEILGRNEILGKNVVSYSYNEIVINRDGETIAYLLGPINLPYAKEKLKVPPKIQSRFLGPNLVSIKSENNTWKIKNINKN